MRNDESLGEMLSRLTARRHSHVKMLSVSPLSTDYSMTHFTCFDKNPRVHPKSFADDFTKSCLRIGCVMNATRASTASSSNNSLFGQFLTSFLFPDRKQHSNNVIGIQQFQPKCR